MPKKGITRKDLLKAAEEKYGTRPEFLWQKYPSYAVLRHSDNGKWYAVIMDIPREKLGLKGSDKVDILDIKCDPLMYGSTIMDEGIFPGYHMKKGNWISVLLDGSVEKQKALILLDMSFDLTKSKTSRARERQNPKEWLVPANPKYYDIEHAFDSEDIILWKQGAGILAGDTVYIYAAAPFSAILYKCEAVEVNIPYSYEGEISIKKAMRIKLLHRFDKDSLTFKKLNEFGVFAVRGPRGVPANLSREIQHIIRGKI